MSETPLSHAVTDAASSMIQELKRELAEVKARILAPANTDWGRGMLAEHKQLERELAEAIRERNEEARRCQGIALQALTSSGEAEDALQYAEELRALAGRVCWFDWSDNDSDAVAAIQALRAALAKNPGPGECPTADRQPMAKAPVSPGGTQFITLCNCERGYCSMVDGWTPPRCRHDVERNVYGEAGPPPEICASPCNQEQCAERDECLRPLVTEPPPCLGGGWQDDGISAIPPGPLRDLGAHLTRLLNDDQWNNTEPLLLACLRQGHSEHELATARANAAHYRADREVLAEYVVALERQITLLREALAAHSEQQDRNAAGYLYAFRCGLCRAGAVPGEAIPHTDDCLLAEANNPANYSGESAEGTD